MSKAVQSALFPSPEVDRGDTAGDSAFRQSIRLRDLPLAEQPQTRLAVCGPTALSSIELLSIVIGGSHALEIATQIVTQTSDLAEIAQLTLPELEQFHGVGVGKAVRVKAAFELGRRASSEERSPTRRIRSPADAANLVVSEMGMLEQEEVRIILLDTKNGVRRIYTLYKGNLNQAVIRVGELFRQAVRENSAALIVVHNHPSGDPTPSPEDAHVTELIVEAGRLLNIDVVDHLVVGHQRYVSMRERGLGFSRADPVLVCQS